MNRLRRFLGRWSRQARQAAAAMIENVRTGEDVVAVLSRPNGAKKTIQEWRLKRWLRKWFA